MDEYLVVDGYNIINAWPGLNKIKEQNFEHARDKLIDIMSNYRGITGKKIIIVFDAHLVPGGVGHQETVAGIQVIFTKSNQTADSLIERLLGELPEGSLKTLATSDWAEQRMALAKGAVRVSAKEMLELVKAADRQTNKLKKHVFSNALDHRLSEDERFQLEKMRRDGRIKEK